MALGLSLLKAAIRVRGAIDGSVSNNPIGLRYGNLGNRWEYQQSSWTWATHDAIPALYTDFSASRQRKLLVFRRSGFGTTRSTLTPIQRHVFGAASIALPTRILPLLAIAKAPQRRFGVSPATTITSRLSPQRLSLGIPNSFDLTCSSRLSRLVQSIYTEFLLFNL